MKPKLFLATGGLLLASAIHGQIFTNGNLITGSAAGHEIFCGDNTIGSTTGLAKLEVRAEDATGFTTSGWRMALRLIAGNEDDETNRHGAALVWDKGSSTDPGAAPFHFFMAGPSDNPNGDFYFGMASDLGAAATPEYIFHVYSAARDGNVAGSVRFRRSLIMHDGGGSPANELGIGILNPSEQLHTSAGVRFEGLTSNASPTRVIVQDNNGKLYYQTLGTGTVLSTTCATTSNVPRLSSAGTLGCSQIYDDNTNVGINTSSPKTKLHVNGQSVWLTSGDGSSLGTSAGSGLRLYYDASTNTGRLFAHDYANGVVKDMIIQGPGGNLGVSMTPGTWAGGGASILGAPPNPTTVKLDVSGMVRCTYAVVTSDARFKRDINPIENALDKVMKLKGVSYYWNNDNSFGRTFDEFKQIGFIAQEVEKIVPEAVGKDADGVYAMNYQALVPLLAEAIKEQQHKIAELEKQLKANAPATQPAAISTDIPVQQAELLQNNPNPFSEQTRIGYVIPETAGSAYLCLFDMQGKMLRKMDVKEKGKGEIVIAGNEMDPGMYLYSLVVDGKEVSTRRMILTR